MKKVNGLLVLSLLIFLFSFGFQVLKTSRLDSTIGEVHLLRDRQWLSENNLVSGNLGRLVANKWMVAWKKTENKVLEITDFNIMFFAGHPNERVNVKEQERMPWLLLPFCLWGLFWVLNHGEKTVKIFASILLLNLAWSIKYQSINDKALAGTLLIFIFLIVVGIIESINFLRKSFKKIKK